MKQVLKNSFYTSLLTATLALSACGPQAFVPSGVSSAQTAAGAMNIPPKVDILMGISMNGTMQNIYPGLSTEIPAFLKNLQNTGWDYRFVSIPLSEYQPTSNYDIAHKVSVSNYDINYPIESWLPPFPGALHTDQTLGLLSGLFSNFFVIPPLDTTHNDAHETGFQNQVDFLSRSDVQSQFLRSDALLAIITLSNGDDRSGGTWPTNSYQPWQPGTPVSAYENSLRAIKGSPLLLKYYSLDAHLTTSCRGYGTYSGIRYEQLTADLGGQSINICTTPLSSALAGVSENLQSVKLSFVKRYLVIGSEPNLGTIKVIKYPASGGSQVLPQDATNGWTYAGAVPSGGVYTIDSPIPMDLVQSGYLIELHGSAKLNGNETADVNYQNAGTVISH